MIDFSFTFDGKAYRASASHTLALTGETHYHVFVKDSDHQHFLKQPVLTRYKNGGYGWPSSSFGVGTEFIKAAAMALIREIKK